MSRTKKVAVLKAALRYGWLVHGRFIVKHKYIRDTSLKYYEAEWKVLVELFYTNEGRITKNQFLLLVGEKNIEYEIVDKMLDLLGDHRKGAPQRNVWWLKHDGANEEMMRSQFGDLCHVGMDALHKMCEGNGGFDDGDVKMA
eukprot:322318_1